MLVCRIDTTVQRSFSQKTFSTWHLNSKVLSISIGVPRMELAMFLWGDTLAGRSRPDQTGSASVSHISQEGFQCISVLHCQCGAAMKYHSYCLDLVCWLALN